MPDARKIILRNHLSPGDVLLMTAAIYGLHKAHPGKFLTAVDTTCQAVWEHNPDVVPAGEGFETAQTNYSTEINRCNQVAVHALQGYCTAFEELLGVKVPLLTNKPLLYLSAEERAWLPQVQEMTKRPTRYAVVAAGHKSCFTAKFWGTENYQRVVDTLRGRVLFVQVGKPEHRHPPLKNVLNLVGKTDDRQLIRLCWHADFGLGPATFLMHIFAALSKPYICILGGREPVPWNSYPLQQTLHTAGLLPCCRDTACWRSRTVALGDGAEQDGSLCADPVPGEEPLPRCLTMIRPEHVVERILLTNGHRMGYP